MRIREDGRVLMNRAELRDLIRGAVEREGGEWTPGRVKRLFAQHNLSHVYRSTIRQMLADLRGAGHLQVHYSPARRFYTPAGGDQ